MPSVPKSGKTSKVSNSLNRQLSMYSQMAAAAGVSVLALAGASEGEVVYTETHQVTQTSFPLYIDLNHDGINDFMLRATYYAGSTGFEVGLDASGIASNRVAGKRVSGSSGYFFQRRPLCRRAPKSDQEATSPFVSHLWQWSISIVSAARIPI